MKVQNKSSIKHLLDMTPLVHHQFLHEDQTAFRLEKRRRFYPITLFLMILVIAPALSQALPVPLILAGVLSRQFHARRQWLLPYEYRHEPEHGVDLMFAAAPSEEQLQTARENGLSLRFTLIGKEAFVFLVNRDNPVQSLTVEQIGAIYTGDIRNWSDVGKGYETILAFQCAEGSGSKGAMQNLVMQRRVMPGLPDGVANYSIVPCAIGYSFRYDATCMKNSDAIWLLEISDVALSIENIRNGTYPFIKGLYIVTA